MKKFDISPVIYILLMICVFLFAL